MYDATYPELVQRIAAPLATRDHALIAATKKEGVAVFEPKEHP